jgi:O-antigen ligase
VAECLRLLEPRDAAATEGGIAGVLLGFVLFGDYLALTLSRALTGSAGSWILVTALLQPLLIIALLNRFGTRSRGALTPILGHCGLCVIAAGHTAPVWLSGDSPGEYAEQKLIALFVLLLPALLAGMLVGRQATAPAARSMHWWLLPLLCLCGLAIATDPRLLTIEHYAEPPVFFDLFVLPAHQPLAFCLAKAALLTFAVHQTASSGGDRTFVRLLFVGVLAGLVLMTGARSYALALVVALALQSMAAGRRLGLVVVGIASAVLLFEGYASDLVQDRFDPTQVLQSLAWLEREESWVLAWQAFAEQPLTGVGPAGFGGAAGWLGRVYPHNLPLEIAAEFGAVGLLCFVAIALPSFVQIGRLVWRRERPTPAGVFAIGLLAFGLIGAMAVGDLIRNYFVWFAFGLATTALRARSPATAARPGLANADAAVPAATTGLSQ